MARSFLISENLTLVVSKSTMGVPSCLCIFVSLVLLTVKPSLVWGSDEPLCGPMIESNDTDKIQFALNLEFLEVEYFCCASTGRGLDYINSTLSQGGPLPIGCRKANLDPLLNMIIEEFCYQEVGHIRAIFDKVGGFQRPLLDISSENFARLLDEAVGYTLDPPFDPCSNSRNYLIGSYIIPYVGLVGYVGAIPNLELKRSRRLVAGLLGVEAGQDAVIRALLYERGQEEVYPYGFTVDELTIYISALRNRLAMCGIKDEGLRVPLELGAENRTNSNVLSANAYSLSYARSPAEILRTVYGTGNESCPGGFYPEGANGYIARTLLGGRLYNY